MTREKQDDELLMLDKDALDKMIDELANESKKLADELRIDDESKNKLVNEIQDLSGVLSRWENSIVVTTVLFSEKSYYDQRHFNIMDIYFPNRFRRGLWLANNQGVAVLDIGRYRVSIAVPIKVDNDIVLKKFDQKVTCQSIKLKNCAMVKFECNYDEKEKKYFAITTLETGDQSKEYFIAGGYAATVTQTYSLDPEVKKAMEKSLQQKREELIVLKNNMSEKNRAIELNLHEINRVIARFLKDQDDYSEFKVADYDAVNQQSSSAPPSGSNNAFSSRTVPTASGSYRHTFFGTMPTLEEVAINYGFTCRNVSGDDLNCLFYSLADQLNTAKRLDLTQNQIEALGRKLRVLAIQYMKGHRDYFSKRVGADNLDDIILGLENGEMNESECTVIALCRALRISVVSISNTSNYPYVARHPQSQCTLYVCQQDEIHFQSLIPLAGHAAAGREKLSSLYERAGMIDTDSSDRQDSLDELLEGIVETDNFAIKTESVEH